MVSALTLASREAASDSLPSLASLNLIKSGAIVSAAASGLRLSPLNPAVPEICSNKSDKNLFSARLVPKSGLINSSSKAEKIAVLAVGKLGAEILSLRAGISGKAKSAGLNKSPKTFSLGVIGTSKNESSREILSLSKGVEINLSSPILPISMAPEGRSSPTN